jgi:hypothetical protein
MDSVNVQILENWYLLKKKLILIEILRKLFFTCNPHFVPPLFSD